MIKHPSSKLSHLSMLQATKIRENVFVNVLNLFNIPPPPIFCSKICCQKLLLELEEDPYRVDQHNFHIWEIIVMENEGFFKKKNQT